VNFGNRSSANKDYLYIWADGVHFNVCLDDERLCTLVVLGALADGTKEPIAIDDGFRQKQSELGECASGPRTPWDEGPFISDP
jgi:hypothetical protein